MTDVSPIPALPTATTTAKPSPPPDRPVVGSKIPAPSSPFDVNFGYRGGIDRLGRFERAAYDHIVKRLEDKMPADRAFLMEAADWIAETTIKIHSKFSKPSTPLGFEDPDSYPDFAPTSATKHSAFVDALRQLSESSAIRDAMLRFVENSYVRAVDVLRRETSAKWVGFDRFPERIIANLEIETTYSVARIANHAMVTFSQVLSDRQRTAIQYLVDAMTGVAASESGESEPEESPPPSPREEVERPLVAHKTPKMQPAIAVIEPTEEEYDWPATDVLLPSTTTTAAAEIYSIGPISTIEVLNSGVVPSRDGVLSAERMVERGSEERKRRALARKREEIAAKREVTEETIAKKLRDVVAKLRTIVDVQEKLSDDLEAELKERKAPEDVVVADEPQRTSGKRPPVHAKRARLVELDSVPDAEKSIDALYETVDTLKFLRSVAKLRAKDLKARLSPASKRRKVASAVPRPSPPVVEEKKKTKKTIEEEEKAKREEQERLTAATALLETAKTISDDAGTDFARVFRKLADPAPIMIGAGRGARTIPTCEAATRMNGPMATLVKWLTAEGLDAVSRLMSKYGIVFDLPDFYDVTTCARRMLWELASAVELALAFDKAEKAKKKADRVRVLPNASWSHTVSVVISSAKSMCNFKPKVDASSGKQELFGYGMFVSGAKSHNLGARPEITRRKNVYFSKDLAYVRGYVVGREFWDACDVGSYIAPKGDANSVVGWERRLASLVVGLLNQNVSGLHAKWSSVNPIIVDRARGELMKVHDKVRTMNEATSAKWFLEIADRYGQSLDFIPEERSDARETIEKVASTIREKVIETACDWIALLANASLSRASAPLGVVDSDAWKFAIGAEVVSALDTIRRSLWTTNEYDVPRRKIDVVINAAFYAIECSSKTLVDVLGPEEGPKKFAEMLRSENPTTLEREEKIKARIAARGGAKSSKGQRQVQVETVKSKEGDTYVPNSPFFPAPDLSRLSIFACEPFSDTLLLIRNGQARHAFPVVDACKVHYWMPPMEVWMRTFLHRGSPPVDVLEVSKALEEICAETGIAAIDRSLRNVPWRNGRRDSNPAATVETRRASRSPLNFPRGRRMLEVGETRLGRRGKFSVILRLTFGKREFESRTRSGNSELDSTFARAMAKRVDPSEFAFARWLRENGCSSAWQIFSAESPSMPALSWIEYADDVRATLLKIAYGRTISKFEARGGVLPRRYSRIGSEEVDDPSNVFLGGAMPYSTPAILASMCGTIIDGNGDAPELGSQWAQFLALACGATRTVEAVHRSYARDPEKFFRALSDAANADPSALATVSGVEWYAKDPGTARDSKFSPSTAVQVYISRTKNERLDPDLNSRGVDVLTREVAFAVVHDELIAMIAKLCDASTRVGMPVLADALRTFVASPSARRGRSRPLAPTLSNRLFVGFKWVESKAKNDAELAHLVSDAVAVAAMPDGNRIIMEFNADKKQKLIESLREFERSARCGSRGLASRVNDVGAVELSFVADPQRTPEEIRRDDAALIGEEDADDAIVIAELKEWLKKYVADRKHASM